MVGGVLVDALLQKRGDLVAGPGRPGAGGSVGAGAAGVAGFAPLAPVVAAAVVHAQAGAVLVLELRFVGAPGIGVARVTVGASSPAQSGVGVVGRLAVIGGHLVACAQTVGVRVDPLIKLCAGDAQAFGVRQVEFR